MSTVSQSFADIDEVYDFLEDIEAENYMIVGSLTSMHPEVKRRTYIGESLEMDLDETYRVLRTEPRTKYKVSLSYSENSVRVTAKIGPLPVMRVKGEQEAFDNFEQFQNFLEEDEGWT